MRITSLPKRKRSRLNHSHNNPWQRDTEVLPPTPTPLPPAQRPSLPIPSHQEAPLTHKRKRPPRTPVPPPIHQRLVEPQDEAQESKETKPAAPPQHPGPPQGSSHQRPSSPATLTVEDRSRTKTNRKKDMLHVVNDVVLPENVCVCVLASPQSLELAAVVD